METSSKAASSALALKEKEWFEGHKAKQVGHPLYGCPFEDRNDIDCAYPLCGCHEEDD